MQLQKVAVTVLIKSIAFLILLAGLIELGLWPVAFYECQFYTEAGNDRRRFMGFPCLISHLCYSSCRDWCRFGLLPERKAHITFLMMMIIIRVSLLIEFSCFFLFEIALQLEGSV
jgi:hypothetical protein